jgi:rhodanese-related sulfurtransferase
MNAQIRHYEGKLAYEIDSWDLKTAMAGGEKIIVVDARSPEAYAREHIPGAINLPHRLMSPETTHALDRSELIVAYCDGIDCNGSSSMDAGTSSMRTGGAGE